MLMRHAQQLGRALVHRRGRPGLIAELHPINSAVQRQRGGADQLVGVTARFGDEMELEPGCWQRTLPSAGMTQIRFLGYEDSVRLVLSPKAPPAFTNVCGPAVYQA